MELRKEFQEIILSICASCFLVGEIAITFVVHGWMTAEIFISRDECLHN